MQMSYNLLTPDYKGGLGLDYSVLGGGAYPSKDNVLSLTNVLTNPTVGVPQTFMGSAFDTVKGLLPLGSLLPDANFQSGFSNVNNISDSIGSLIGFGPEDRTSVLSRSSEQAKKVMTDTLAILQTAGKTKALAFLDDFMQKEAKNLSRMKSANSKASGKQKLEQLTAFRLELVNYDVNGGKIPTSTKTDVSVKQGNSTTSNFGGASGSWEEDSKEINPVLKWVLILLLPFGLVAYGVYKLVKK